jgi:hypothetical protein
MLYFAIYTCCCQGWLQQAKSRLVVEQVTCGRRLHLAVPSLSTVYCVPNPLSFCMTCRNAGSRCRRGACRHGGGFSQMKVFVCKCALSQEVWGLHILTGGALRCVYSYGTLNFAARNGHPKSRGDSNAASARRMARLGFYSASFDKVFRALQRRMGAASRRDRIGAHTTT